jgi:PPOX class probable F420-dependent enzyme
MDTHERESFLTEPRTAVLATVGPHGMAHAVPVWFRYCDGTFRIITERGSQKHRNVERTGRATLCVDERDGSLRYVAAEGPVEVLETVTADDRLALYTHYRGRDRAEKVVAKGGNERMVMLLLRPERWLPTGSH